jgi:hypothetical protein
LAICEQQRCKRTAEVAPKLIIPCKVGAAFDDRRDYAVMLGAKLCRRCCLRLTAKDQAEMPNTIAFVRAGARINARRFRRPYEEPDFARAKIGLVRLGGEEFRRLEPRLAPPPTPPADSNLRPRSHD